MSVDQITEDHAVKSPETSSRPSRFSRHFPSRRSVLKWLPVVVLAISGFAWLLSWWSPVPVRVVTVVGASEDSVAGILKAVGSVEGQALRDVDVDEITERVLDLPGIQGVDLALQRPWTVAIVVDERHASGQVEAENGYVVVDSSGGTIRVTKKRVKRLPLLEGEPESLVTAVAVLNQLPRSLTRRLDSVRTGEDGRTELTLGNGIVVHLGSADSVARKAEVAESLLHFEPSTINVAVPERPAVTGELKLPRANREPEN